MRLVTVQFAIPDDDPSFKLSHLRDEIQEHLFDAEGMGGSFDIIGAQEMHHRADSYFQFHGAVFDAGAIKPNAAAYIAAEKESV